MAEIKPIGGQVPALRPSGTPAPAANAVQRAFFEAALRRTETPALSPSAQSSPPATGALRPLSTVATESAAGGRLLRPGSRLDIKV